MPDTLDQVKKLNGFLRDILKAKLKQKDLDIDVTFQKFQTKNVCMMGPNTNPSFSPSPLLNLKTIQAHSFEAISPPYILDFLELSLKNRIFQSNPIILKFFILNPIRSFKSN